MEESSAASTDVSGETNSKHHLWTEEHEKILIEWADKAMCYRWLHSRSNLMYSGLNAWYTIPVIVISTLTGTANFAQERVPLDYQNYFAMVVGAFNILGGIISTVQQFLKITQLNEAHRVSSIAWDKFYRNVKIELAKHPDERVRVDHMLKISKEEYDRLMETSPTIPEKIIKSFKFSFEKTEMYGSILKPEICDVLISTESFKNQWNSEENKEKRYQEDMQKYIQTTNAKATKEKMLLEQNNKTVLDFKKQFMDLNNREPMDSEIFDNLKDKIEETFLKSLIEKQKGDKEDVMGTELV
jgi:hypothetical protein